MSFKTVRTVCPAHCGINACGINAMVQDGMVVKLEPADFPQPSFQRICLRGLSTLEVLYHPQRLRYPLKRSGKRGEDRWQRISWDDALGTIASNLKEIAGRYGPQAMAFVLGGPGTGTTKFGAYLKFASAYQGTRVSTWGYGDAAPPCATIAMFGIHRARPMLASFKNPKLNLCWGTNPAEAAPFVMRDILFQKDTCARLVVVDPVFTPTAAKADEYLGVIPGTDAALALGMMHVIIDEHLHDEAFIRQHTVGPFLVREDDGTFLREPGSRAGQDDYFVWDEGAGEARRADQSNEGSPLYGKYLINSIACRPAFQLLAEVVAGYPPEKVSPITGIPKETIIKLARVYAKDRPANIHTNNGMGRTFHGDLSFRAVCTLATITGNITLPGASEHRNIVLNWEPFLKPAPGKSFRRMGVLNMYQAISEGKPYPIRGAWFAFCNFVNQCANSNRIVNELFPKLDFIVDTELFMNETARYADIVLPVCTFLEFSDLVAAPMPYLQLQQKVIEPLYESMSDVNILRQLAQRTGFGSHFARTEEELIEELLASGHPSMNRITLDKLRVGPREVAIPESSSHAVFPTKSTRIEFYVEKLRSFGEQLPSYKEPCESKQSVIARTYPLSLVQVHSRFRHHSSYANVPSLLELNPEPVVDINPADAGERSIADHDLVRVFNARGSATLRARVNHGVRPGVVNMCQGWWFSQFVQGGLNFLTHDRVNPSQDSVYEPNMAMNDVLVNMEKVT